MVKGKRNGLTSTECSVKPADFYRFHHHIENGATTMQRNRSAHTALGNHRSSHVNTLTTRNAKHQWTHRAILKSSKKLSLLTIWQNLTTTIGRVRASKIASAACPCPFPRSFTPLLIKLIFVFIHTISFY